MPVAFNAYYYIIGREFDKTRRRFIGEKLSTLACPARAYICGFGRQNYLPGFSKYFTILVTSSVINDVFLALQMYQILQLEIVGGNEQAGLPNRSPSSGWIWHFN